jgi:hypothetical protein
MNQKHKASVRVKEKGDGILLFVIIVLADNFNIVSNQVY